MQNKTVFASRARDIGIIVREKSDAFNKYYIMPFGEWQFLFFIIIFRENCSLYI